MTIAIVVAITYFVVGVFVMSLCKVSASADDLNERILEQHREDD